MNSVASMDGVSWSFRRCCWIATFIFLGQASLIWMAEERPKLLPSTANAKTSFQLIVAPLKSDDIFRLIAAPLPDIFALPNEAGFSGPGWLKLKKTDYSPPQWNEPPRWLAHDAKYLGKAFSHSFSATEDVLEQAEKISSRDDVPVFLPQTGQDSSLRIEGSLAKRFMDSVTLPSWQNFEPLHDSVVEIGVNSAGNIVSSRLISRSGSTDADQKALELARVAKFQPLNTAPAGPVFGKMVFRWETLPVSTSNSVEEKPSNAAR